MLLASLLAAASVVALPADLAKAAHDYDVAQTTSNRAELERLIAPDYVLHNSGGQVQDKTRRNERRTIPIQEMRP